MGDSKDRARVGGKKTRDSVLKPHKGKKKAVEEKKIEETKDTAKSALSALIEQDGKVVEEVSASAGEQESESFSEEKTEDFEQSTEELDTTEAEEIEIPDTFSGMHPTEPVNKICIRKKKRYLSLMIFRRTFEFSVKPGIRWWMHARKRLKSPMPLKKRRCIRKIENLRNKRYLQPHMNRCHLWKRRVQRD